MASSPTKVVKIPKNHLLMPASARIWNRSTQGPFPHLNFSSIVFSVLIWSCKDFSQKEHKTMRGNVSYDHGTMVRWSPDSKAYVVHRATENAPEVYKINKRDDGSLGNIQGNAES